MYLHAGHSDVMLLTFFCQLAANKCHDTINSMIGSPSLVSLVLCLLFFAVLMFHGPEFGIHVVMITMACMLRDDGDD